MRIFEGEHDAELKMMFDDADETAEDTEELKIQNNQKLLDT